MGNSPQDGTVLDAIVLKSWYMNDVLAQKQFKSKLGYDDTSADPGIMLVQDPLGVSVKSDTVICIGQYLSCVQNIQFYKEPKIRQ
eukprot:1600367-Ditylum_brightwellii.AAC.1